MHDVEGFGREMCVACGGTGAVVPEELLDDAQRDPTLQEMHGVGMPERVDRGVFGEAALAHHELKGLLEGSRRQGRLLMPSWEQPWPGAGALPVRSQPLQGPFGQGHQAVFAPFALADPDQHALGVNVRDLEMGPFPEAPVHRRSSSADTCLL
jgi:hypothetical protein